MIDIRVLQDEDAERCHRLRLRGLAANPEAFGSTYEREAGFTWETVKERVRPTPHKFVLGCYVEGKLAGIVTLVRETGPKTGHKANIYGMFVAPELRGQGVGRALLSELIRMAGQLEGLEQLNLTVVSGNAAAKKLYESMGFQCYGVERNALKYEGRYADEDLMVLMLRP